MSPPNLFLLLLPEWFLSPDRIHQSAVFVQKIYVSKYKIIGLSIVLILVCINLFNNPFRFSPNKQMQRAQNVASEIIRQSAEKDFNIAVVAERNYEDGYQYFLEKENTKVVEIDAQRPETVTDQLFVICEESICEPIGNPLWEIAAFGWAKVDQQWEFPWGVKVFKLIHNPSGKP